MREPLPKELVRLAWKARVGLMAERMATHRFYSNNKKGGLHRHGHTFYWSLYFVSKHVRLVRMWMGRSRPSTPGVPVV